MPMLLDLITSTAIGLVAYHHAGYPLLLRAVARTAPDRPDVPARGYRSGSGDRALPSVTVLIPAYNEAAVIAQKVMNVLSLDYPADRLRLRIICDGCSDGTNEAAIAATGFDDDALARITVVNCMENRGKVAVLNEQIPRCDTDLVALTDASSIVAVDALLKAVPYFADTDVAVVSGSYRLLEATLVRVVPEGAGIDRVKLVDECLARADRPLRQVRHAIHTVRQPDAVPVDGGLLVEAVLNENPQALALAHANLRAGDEAIVAPRQCLAVRFRDKADTVRRRAQPDLFHRRRMHPSGH